MIDRSAVVQPFASAHSRAQWAVGLLALGIVLDLTAIGSDLLQIRLIAGIIAGQDIVDQEVAANDSRQQLIGIAQILVYILSAIAFLIWIHRAHRNLPALGARGLRFTPGWTVGWFFVPIMNLFRPYQVAKEIWRASDPETASSDGLAWQSFGVPALIGWWWGFWLLQNFAGQVVFRLTSGAETAEAFLTASWATLVSDGLSSIAAVLVILVIRGIDIRQTFKSQRLDYPHLDFGSLGTGS
ncbi:MAG TPA: DUF4328 domain-containing protein [Roseiflexaceae bacterium]|nr:DUF4328 domain-containing protein [Roseiflexaceae bacterium]